MSRKRLPVWRTLLVMAIDLVGIVMGLCLAYWIRFHSPLTALIPVRGGFNPQHYLEILPLACVVWFVALRLENLYRRRSRVLDFSVFSRIVTGSLVALLVLIALAFFDSDREAMGNYSRLLSVIALASVVGTLTVLRAAEHHLFQWLILHRGLGQSRVALVGSGEVVERLTQAMRAHPERGMLPIAIVTGHRPPEPADAASTVAPGGVPIVGSVAQLEQLLVLHRIDEVVMVQADVDYERIPNLLLQCERAHAEFRIVPETTERLLSGMTVETLAGVPLLGLRETPLQGWNAALKRLIDIAVAAVGLLLFAPFIALFWTLVRRYDGGPGFFLQERMGIDGRMFRIVKLRTMRLDAENRTGPVFATDRDPRCTPLGEFLRRSHLDELPQLINVLRGEMSLVGPRPERPYFIEQFRDNIPRYMARHKVKSGITGWAQVNGLCGRHGSINDRLKYDLYYIENWSLWLDIKILTMTVFGRVKPGSPIPQG